MTVVTPAEAESLSNTASLHAMKDATRSPRRVLFVDHTACLGGGEIALLDLVRHLDPAHCIPVALLCSDGPLHEKLVAAGIETYLLPLSSDIVQTRKDSLDGKVLLRVRAAGAMLGYIARLARFMRAQRIDIVHTNSLKADILGGLAARLARIPVVWHIRDRIETDYLPARVVRLFRLLCRRIPDFVVANSEATLQTLHLNRSDRQAVIYSGVDLDRFAAVLPDEGDTAGRCLFCQPDGTVQIGMVGRISPWKGQHIFVRAAAKVHAQFPNARFRIVGAALFEEQAYEQEVRALATSLGIMEAIEFTGFCDAVPEIMAGLDILVHASTSGEPFGQVVVQGMAAGRPVVATRGGGIPEIIVDGVTGLLVPMGNNAALAEAIIHLLRHPDQAVEMGRLGRQCVSDRFTIQLSARKAEEVYAVVRCRGSQLRRERTPF